MFIDYVALLLVNTVAGFVVLAHYVNFGLGRDEDRKWVPALLAVGLIAFLDGLHMVWNWPLPGSYNGAYGELSVMWGALFLAAGLAMGMGWNLVPVSIYGVLVGITAVIIGGGIIRLRLTNTPVLAGIGFILSGIAGVLSPLMLRLQSLTWLKKMAALFLIVIALIWAKIGYTAYWTHLQGFREWKPATMEGHIK